MNKDLFVNYQTLINTVAKTSALSIETLSNIAKNNIFDGYNEFVEQQLYVSGFICEYVQVALYNGNKINYEEELICQVIRNNKFNFIKNKNLFFNLRENICKTDIETVESYNFLFDNTSPFITENELNLLSNMGIDDVTIWDYISSGLLNENNLDILISFFNRKYHNNTEAFIILINIASCTSILAHNWFYNIDFSCFRYDMFAKSKKEIIKEKYFSILDLMDAENKIEFMSATHYIDKDFENDIFEYINEDEDLCKKYIKAVNKCKTIYKHTVNTLSKLDLIYPMTDIVNEAFFENQKYEHYVVSKTINSGFFEIEQGKKGEILWPIYVDIFKKQKYQKTCNHMKNNTTFLYRIQALELYEGVSEDTRLQLTGILQDAKSLENVLTYGEDFALKYYSTILGFKDYDAAKVFVDLIVDSKKLLLSQEVYDNTYEKLLNSQLKAKYTRCRKNAIRNS